MSAELYLTCMANKKLQVENRELESHLNAQLSERTIDVLSECS